MEPSEKGIRPWLSLAGVMLALTALAPGCSVDAGPIEGTGIGERCIQSSDCHAGFCDNGVCTATCSKADDCPAPSGCYAGKCALPLKVAALWEGVVSAGEGWNWGHHQALKEAMSQLPYATWKYEEAITAKPGPLVNEIEEHVEAGAHVIVVDSFNQQFEAIEMANKYPDKRFLLGGGSMTNERNAGAFYANYEQAAYVAGQVAASRATRRIGIIPALVTPEQVREVNAFTLGARSVNPKLVVEVAWIGFWEDYLTAPAYEFEGERLYREEALAARMVKSGCEVIFHQSDNNRAVRYVDKLVSSGKASGVTTIATNNREGYRFLTPDGTGAPIPTALGSAFYNWAPYYKRALDEIHRGVWKAEMLTMPMTADADSAVGFEANPGAGIDVGNVRRFLLAVAEAGPGKVFEGPYETTGQRDVDGDGVPDPVQSVAAGERIAEGEYHTMCWYVKGVVMKENPLDPTSADVDAKVPNPGFPPPSDLLGPPGAPAGVGVTCGENL